MNKMLTSSERHFVEQWREQKSGPKWKYYLLYSVAWSVVSFLVIFFLTKLFTNLWETGGPNLIYLIIVISIISGISSTHYNYVNSEKRYKKILDKEKGLLN
jgi:cation transporter-like permease